MIFPDGAEDHKGPDDHEEDSDDPVEPDFDDWI